MLLLFSKVESVLIPYPSPRLDQLGILSRSKPILLTTLRPVPPGTNGAISARGTGVSLIGGAGLGALFWSLDGRTRLGESCGKWIVLGGLAGLGGSLLDSVLGSTLQRTYYNTETKRILLHNPANTRDHDDGKPDERDGQAGSGSNARQLQVVAGWDVLTNNQVNFISSATVSGIMACLAWNGFI